MKKKIELFLPFILTAVVIILDQLTKMLIVNIADGNIVITSLFGDFIRIILVYNTGAAFSFGVNFAPVLHFILLKILPLALIIGFLPIYFRVNFTHIERWLIAAVIGGGIGNLIDRFFRSNGVVDFIDVKFYGLFGLERWPTFNVADSVVVVSFSILILYNFFKKNESAINEKSENN